MPQLYDMHCHLDFSDDAEAIAKGVEGRIVAIDSTVVPSSFVSARERLAAFPDVRVALGIHPWWVANGRVGEVDVKRFETLLPETRLVGEVGLDFAGRNKDSKAHQMEVFARVLDAIAREDDGRLVFLHAVKGCHDMLNMMEEYGTFDGNSCVFHWFSGTHDDFGRALALGGMFSVNMRMLATSAGLEYAKAVPEERLLMETDSPAHEGEEWSAGAWLQEAENTARGLAEARGVDYARMLDLLAENGKRLIEKHR